MDYLELDNSAIQTLTELGGGVDYHLPAAISTPAAENPICPRPLRHRRVQATYLLLLAIPFSTALDVANILGLSRVPKLETGSGEDGEAQFCRLSQPSIDALESCTSKHYPKKRFHRVRLGSAHKDASELPLLGRDSTLPQHRPTAPTSPTHAPSKSEYPVTYFFYGTLAEPERLARLFDVPESCLGKLEPAILLDGRIKIWADKYWALVEYPGGQVEGFGYLVASAEEEDALRMYEGTATRWCVLG